MTVEQKRDLIYQILASLTLADKSYSDGDMFFALCFKSDEELNKIAKELQIL